MSRPRIMGVLNVTPDSFSDGGRWMQFEAAVERGLEMAAQGADIIDVGGESTRPGAEPVEASEELARVEPVVRALARAGLTVSIDTQKPSVAHACLTAGAQIVNDVGALSAPGMTEICAAFGCTVCLMHMKGQPRTMQQSPEYRDVKAEVKAFLLNRAEMIQDAGVASEKIWIDPGIGFGKTLRHNLELLHGLGEMVSLGYPVLIGVSRKSFLGSLQSISGEPEPVEARLSGTLAAQVLAQMQGASIIRCHDVVETRRAAEVAAAVLDPSLY